VIFGDSGVGKSTFANILAKIKLIARRNAA
jgi:adenylate kinase family enzyme